MEAWFHTQERWTREVKSILHIQ